MVMVRVWVRAIRNIVLSQYSARNIKIRKFLYELDQTKVLL